MDLEPLLLLSQWLGATVVVVVVSIVLVVVRQVKVRVVV